MTSPTLHDDRIEKMRLTVMHDVDQDIKRRGRRTRGVIGATAASVLIVGFGGYAVNQSDGGGTSDVASDSSSRQYATEQAVPQPAAADEPGAGDRSSLTKQAPTDQAPVDQAPVDADRQVITTGDVSVTVKNPKAVAQRLSTWVESIGGRVDNRSETGTGRDASAYVTVRVPSDRVSATIDRLGTYGTVEDVNLQNDDVTSQAKDLDARINALNLSIDRLEKIMAKADTSQELITAEGALTTRQEQLESLVAQRKGIADQVSLSTVSINLNPTQSVDSVEPGGFQGGLRDGWNSLVSAVNNVVEAVGVALPWAIVLGLVSGVACLVVRRRRRS